MPSPTLEAWAFYADASLASTGYLWDVNGSPSLIKGWQNLGGTSTPPVAGQLLEVFCAIGFHWCNQGSPVAAPSVAGWNVRASAQFSGTSGLRGYGAVYWKTAAGNSSDDLSSLYSLITTANSACVPILVGVCMSAGATEEYTGSTDSAWSQYMSTTPPPFYTTPYPNNHAVIDSTDMVFGLLFAEDIDLSGNPPPWVTTVSQPFGTTQLIGEVASDTSGYFTPSDPTITIVNAFVTFPGVTQPPQYTATYTEPSMYQPPNSYGFVVVIKGVASTPYTAAAPAAMGLTFAPASSVTAPTTIGAPAALCAALTPASTITAAIQITGPAALALTIAPSGTVTAAVQITANSAMGFSFAPAGNETTPTQVTTTSGLGLSVAPAGLVTTSAAPSAYTAAASSAIALTLAPPGSSTTPVGVTAPSARGAVIAPSGKSSSGATAAATSALGLGFAPAGFVTAPTPYTAAAPSIVTLTRAPAGYVNTNLQITLGTFRFERMRPQFLFERAPSMFAFKRRT